MISNRWTGGQTSLQRDFRLHVPRDCIASNSIEENEAALQQMEQVLKAITQESGEIDLRKQRKFVSRSFLCWSM